MALPTQDEEHIHQRAVSEPCSPMCSHQISLINYFITHLVSGQSCSSGRQQLNQICSKDKTGPSSQETPEQKEDHHRQINVFSKMYLVITSVSQSFVLLQRLILQCPC